MQLNYRSKDVNTSFETILEEEEDANVGIVVNS